jgi:membrane-bound lytic murein transglycosylase D
LRSASAIKVGQTLQVADNSVSSASSSNGGSITYQVRKGDSLSSIAKRHGVNIKDVMRWNAGTDNLQPGNKLTLFVSNKLTPDT